MTTSNRNPGTVRTEDGVKQPAAARRALGRGLDALIPTEPSAQSGDGRLQASIGAIVPNPSQPRRDFDQAELDELAESIREHGILQPLLVRASESGRYLLIAGERRWRAARLAGLKQVPIVVQQAGGDRARERLTLALVENVQRSDLNPIELATAFEQLSESGWSQMMIARQVSRSRASVANIMRLRQLREPTQALVASGALSEGHGRALLGAPRSQQLKLAQQAVEDGWTVRELEAAVKAAAEPKPKTQVQSPEPSPVMQKAVQRLESSLGTRVEVKTGAKGPAGGGRIVIHWYDEEQLSALSAQMSGLPAVESASGEDAEEFGI